MQTLSSDDLQSIENHFHDVIHGRVGHLQSVANHEINLPVLAELINSPQRTRAWFRVPGMYGGFRYWFEWQGDHAKLVSISSSRVAGRSGQRHEITVEGCKLVAEGFD